MNGDIFFSMRFPLGEGLLKQLIPREIDELLAAAATRVGVDPNRYLTKSLKIGGISGLKFAGASQDEISLAGRHASVKSSQAYQRIMMPDSNHGSGALGASDIENFTVNAVIGSNIGRASNNRIKNSRSSKVAAAYNNGKR